MVPVLVELFQIVSMVLRLVSVILFTSGRMNGKLMFYSGSTFIYIRKEVHIDISYITVKIVFYFATPLFYRNIYKRIPAINTRKWVGVNGWRIKHSVILLKT